MKSYFLTIPNGIEMNAYFATHPEQICGTMEMVSGPFGPESTCQPNRETKLSEQIRAAMANIQGVIDTKKVSKDEEMGLEAPKAPESLRNSSYFISDGKPYFLESGVSQPVTLPKSKAKKSLAVMTDLIAIRDTVRQLLEMQLDEMVSDEAIKAVQATLSTMYDKFAEKYGRITDKGTFRCLGFNLWRECYANGAYSRRKQLSCKDKIFKILQSA